MATIDAEFEAIRWIITGRTSISSATNLDESRLTRLITEHRLSHRFVCRLDAGLPIRFSPRFIAAQIYASRNAHRNYEAQLAVSSALSSRLVELGLAPITVFKGMATYALTVDLRHLPICDDIDFFHEDQEQAMAILQELGYEIERHKPRRHEIAVLQSPKTSAKFEPHRFFQSWRYSSDIANRLKDVGSYSRRLVGPGPSVFDIEFSQLAKHCVAGRAPGTDSITVPNVSASALLLCIHAFTHAIEPDFWYIRLSEIANIHDLLETNEFSYPLFWQLARAFAAEDSIALVLAALRYWYQCLPRSLDALPSSLKGREVFPIRLCHQGGWAAPFSIAELHVPFSERAFTENLGVQSIDAEPFEGHVRESYSNQPNLSGSIVIPCIESVRAEDEAALRVEFKISWDQTDVVFRVHAPDSLLTSPGEAYIASLIDCRRGNSIFDRGRMQYSYDDMVITKSGLRDSFSDRLGHHFQLCLPHNGEDHVRCLLQFSRRDGPYDDSQGPTVVFALNIRRLGEPSPISTRNAQSEWESAGFQYWMGYTLSGDIVKKCVNEIARYGV